jgi:hypothetical protein
MKYQGEGDVPAAAFRDESAFDNIRPNEAADNNNLTTPGMCMRHKSFRVMVIRKSF